MDAGIERRGEKGRRIPLDVLVELLHDDYAEPFEADGVNVGLGGLSMRAPYLPDIGARMTCRFEVPGGTERIEAGAEVVWSQDTGKHTGEFGLRFVEIDEAAHRAIRKLVGGGSYRPPAPSHPDTIDEHPAPPTVSLSLDGVASPIVARVIHSGADGIAVEQELPFLRLRTGVTAPDGRRGRIEAVELLVDGDTPKLLLDITYDPRSFVVPEADATIPDFIATAGEGAGGPRTTTEDDQDSSKTSADHPGGVRAEGAGGPRITNEDTHDDAFADAGMAAGADDDEIEDVPTEEGPRTVVVAPSIPVPPRGREPSQVFVTTSREQHERELAEIREREAAEARALEAALADPVVLPGRFVKLGHVVASLRGSGVGAKMAPALAASRAKLAVLFAKLGPLGAIVIARLGAIGGAIAARSGPWTKRAALGVRGAFVRATTAVRETLGRRFPRLLPREARRRTTTAPPRESNVARQKLRKQHREQAVPAPRGKGRIVLAAAIALAAVALGVYAFLPADEEPTAERIEVPREIAPPPASETEPATAATADTNAALGVAEPVASPSVAITPTMPTAMGDPAREAGPIPAPTFPSLREGARPAAPATLPEGSPYAVDTRAGDVGAPPAAPSASASGSTFGDASVANARTFLIRMSRPVDAIEGTRLTDGFRVRIPGSLSLDRAGPIASTHPHVERSMILNRGDHAELTIRFTEGRTPSYRVVARGSAIEILISE